MRVSSKRMAMAMHVFILLLHLTYYHVSFFFEIIQENDRKKISSYNFHFQFVDNFQFHNIIKIN